MTGNIGSNVFSSLEGCLENEIGSAWTMRSDNEAVPSRSGEGPHEPFFTSDYPAGQKRNRAPDEVALRLNEVDVFQVVEAATTAEDVLDADRLLVVEGVEDVQEKVRLDPVSVPPPSRRPPERRSRRGRPRNPGNDLRIMRIFAETLPTGCRI